MVINVDTAVGDEKDRRQNGTRQEQNEIPVVSLTDTVVAPDTMMIVCQDTCFTRRTVRCSWGSPYPAGCAVF